MSGTLRAIEPGPHVTLQDAGRRGWRRFGVTRSGAMDLPALVAANALVGNPPDTAALEFAHVGGTWQIAVEACRIAVTGGDFAVSADGSALATGRATRCGVASTSRSGARPTRSGATSRWHRASR
jgi:5-oxoprolinase (ATP-hydrolysing) subunit C